MAHPRTHHSLLVSLIALAILALPALACARPTVERNDRPHASALVETGDPSTRPPAGSESERQSLELDAPLGHTCLVLKCRRESPYTWHGLDAACGASLQKLHIRLNL